MLELLEEIRSIAIEGKNFAINPYDLERYNRLYELSIQEYSQILNEDREYLKKKFENEIGCITPKVGVVGIIRNSNNQLLILQRKDDSKWCFPCGFLNFNESIIEGLCREIYEEIKVKVKRYRLLGVLDKGPKDYSDIVLSQVNIIYFIEEYSPSEIDLSQISIEHLRSKWLSIEENINWHSGHEKIFEEYINKVIREEHMNI